MRVENPLSSEGPHSYVTRTPVARNQPGCFCRWLGLGKGLGVWVEGSDLARVDQRSSG